MFCTTRVVKGLGKHMLFANILHHLSALCTNSCEHKGLRFCKAHTSSGTLVFAKNDPPTDNYWFVEKLAKHVNNSCVLKRRLAEPNEQPVFMQTVCKAKC